MKAIFATLKFVGESVEKPLKYFNNNVYGMQILLESMVKHGVDKIILSLTASTYGESKLIMEKMMKWVSLRYFNAAGAVEDGSIRPHYDFW